MASAKLLNQRQEQNDSPTTPRIAVAILLSLAVSGCSKGSDTIPTLTVFCAASLEEPVRQLAQEFEQQHRMRIDLQFGGTPLLISQASLSGIADVLISADQLSTELLLSSDANATVFPIARQRPVIAISAFDKGHVKNLKDLYSPNTRLGLGGQEATSIGRTSVQALGNLAPPLYAKAEVIRMSVTALATDLQVGSIDAAIIWNTTARQFQLSTIPDPSLSAASEVASAVVFSERQNRPLALAFASFLSKTTTARQTFRKLGFDVAEAAPDVRTSP